MQGIFEPDEYPDLVVGLGQPDDAAVYRIDEGRVIVATLDFFTPVVDDPYDYGAIAAANALSDLYAMGVEPLFALNISAMPPSLDVRIVSEIMRGGAEKVLEAGAIVAGGHSIQDEEPKYGLVAIGIGEEPKLIKKDGAAVGDYLVLTKPLGTGVTTTALRAGDAETEHVQEVVEWMSRLNRKASKVARAVEVKAGTDITGFSLLGHGIELSEASNIGLRLALKRIPFLSGAKKYADMGKFPGGSADNRLFFRDRVTFHRKIDEVTQMLLFDAQTSGGLLLAVNPAMAADFVQHADREGLAYWFIGEVVSGAGIEVIERLGSMSLPDSSRVGGIWFHSV